MNLCTLLHSHHIPSQCSTEHTNASHCISAHPNSFQCIPVPPTASWGLTLQLKFCNQEVPRGRRHVRTFNTLGVGVTIRSRISFSLATALRASLSRGRQSLRSRGRGSPRCLLKDLEALAQGWPSTDELPATEVLEIGGDEELELVCVGTGGDLVRFSGGSCMVQSVWKARLRFWMRSSCFKMYQQGIPPHSGPRWL